MLKETNTEIRRTGAPRLLVKTYTIRTLLITLVFPLLSIWIEYNRSKISPDPELIGKWFIFWAFGVRIFVAGLSQVLNPAFITMRLFNLRNPKGFVIVKELGIVNICIGILGIASLFFNEGRTIAAITSGIYFLICCVRHFSVKPANNREIVTTVIDLIVFSIILLYLCFTLFF